jgi:hypothetical protein
MDLNFRYFQHQISLMRAAASDDPLLRTKRLTAANGLASQIGIYQHSKGASAAASWFRISDASEPPADAISGLLA